MPNNSYVSEECNKQNHDNCPIDDCTCDCHKEARIDLDPM